MKYEIYLDVFWVTNFVMDFFVLIIARYIKKGHGPIYRLFLGAAFGSTGSVILFLLLKDYSLYQLLIHLLINPCMILISWSVKRIREFIRDFLLVYLLMLFLGGILNWGIGTLGGIKYFWLWAMGGFVICILSLHFWESRRLESQFCEIILQTTERNIMIKGFLDTGNLLMDPFMNQPVHIIQELVLARELEGEKLAIRYIPYHSLGQEQGILPVVTLKGMYVKKEGRGKAESPIYIEKPVFGLAKEKLFQKNDCQVILNGRLTI